MREKVSIVTWEYYTNDGEFIPNTILLTLTNNGYQDFTLSLIESIEILDNIKKKILIIYWLFR